MIVFPIVIIISLVLYVYYKVAIYRTDDILLQLYLNAKGRIFLGLFVLSFGINEYLFYQTRVALYIGIVFILLGGFQAFDGIKQTLHYGAEWKKANNDAKS